MKLDSYLKLYTKIYSKWIKGLNVSVKTIQFVEKSIDINVGSGNVFLDMTPKVQATTTTTNKFDFIKI